jgi:hypothetical protein
VPYLGNSLGVAFSSYKTIDNLTASFNGTATSFALTVNGVTPVPFPLNEQNVLITVGGVPQKPDPTGAEGFRFSGSNIVFSSAPKTGEAFWGVVLAGADRVNAGVQYPDGTAAVPSISFASQTTTGFYRSGSGQIGVGINGSTPVVFSTSGLQLNGSTSGYTILAVPSAAGSNTLTLPTGNGSAYQVLRNGATAGSLEFTDKIVSGTAQNSTSGTSIDFTGIPSWAKRVTVMFNGVSTSGTSIVQLQVGAGSITSTGYYSTTQFGASFGSLTSGFGLVIAGGIVSGSVLHGVFTINAIGSNVWVQSGNVMTVNNVVFASAGSSPTLSGTLDRVRITTVNGTDTFDAGSVNILYE